MSKLEKTANKIDSSNKKAIMYSFALFFNDLFQHKIIQIGVKNAVSTIISNASPSIPKVQLILKPLNHEVIATN